ncbi:hypothetical protein [Mucilaginibacter phyllosphaerae]|uniref:Lipoprotein n=1 Tax=Mucilaginibacter phyllosphaerae TaxID=1812349 RepID=A0A4Y8ABU1_9SPHI|nr:hypothetical protein [Mucilaginibacter phyllosphaerae]MBB3969197.1 hypothetical protein [Mucilaginibacter phyllosphaerae]TEW65997.1 hypothetical protein E2R65_12790 [Mucilaginibacter phyllosphaerae]GGH06952.1 hypothetical protein GCM10007352_11400 [Mucilaginibacter phyllosphaerae]
MQLKRHLFYVAAAALAFSACQNQHADLAEKPKPVTFNYDSLSYEQAKNYVKNYEKRAGTVDSTYKERGVNLVKRRPDTRCIWFSAQRLQTLLDKIKSEGGDGIRFYLATYDTTYNAKMIGGIVPPREYWGYNTLIMVSTKDSTNKVDEKFHRDYFTSKPANSNKPALGFIVGAPPENRGELCPPPVKCTSVGALLIP